jgi:GNAT superfamily N-acetyltransferase
MPGAPPRLGIRPATLSDLPELHRIADLAADRVTSRHYTAREMDAAREAGAFHVEVGLVTAGTYYVVEVDGRVVGGSGWSLGSGSSSQPGYVGANGAAGTAVLRAAYVDPEYARRGLISLLVGVSEVAAGLAGLHRCEAVCTPPSEGMLRKLGYHLVERTTVPMTDEVSWQGARMRKSLVAASA